jgi:hypothetical protein
MNPGVIWCVVILSVVFVGIWLPLRAEVRADARRAARSRHPAKRRVHPGRPVDGKPLSREQRGELIGIVQASATRIPEPRYRSHRG